MTKHSYCSEEEGEGGGGDKYEGNIYEVCTWKGSKEVGRSPLFSIFKPFKAEVYIIYSFLIKNEEK